MLAGSHVSEVKDKWRWSFNASGIFSTQSFKNLSYATDLQMRFISAKGCRWVPAKCNIFLWRAGLDRLPTREALNKRNIAVDSSSCVFCNEANESVDHLFTACSTAHRVWYRLSVWIKMQPFFAFSVQDLADIHKSYNGDKKAKEIVRGLIVVSYWCLWKNWNERIFANGRGSGDDIFREVKLLSFFWLKNRSSICNLDWEKWSKYPLYML
ncbi:uncharacterized protein LOC110932328 [Helianthus annuus]|uniref:uncharacterized protein LOC110932328 n=1 Tax=Helianthus annuus TaxID=4232 RepID=UPI000B8F1CF5|nr:uncharacterized protein LOC110932328 [Helianthus annuus]